MQTAPRRADPTFPDSTANETNVDSTQAVLALTVRNHPGVMSHVCGLFARRGFNVDAIVCLPVGDGSQSRLLLRVHAQDRLEQLVRQLRKLEDVRIAEFEPAGTAIFRRLEEWFLSPPK